MTTPIRFHGFDGDRRLLVLVGKSDRLREVTVTRDQAARIIRRALNDGDPSTPCGRGPCALGDGHTGNCRM